MRRADGGGGGGGLFRHELVEAFDAAEAHVKSGLRSTHRLADGVGELCVATRAYDDALRRFLALQTDNEASGEVGGESDDPVPAVQRMLLGLSATVSAVATATHSSANLLQRMHQQMREWLREADGVVEAVHEEMETLEEEQEKLREAAIAARDAYAEWTSRADDMARRFLHADLTERIAMAPLLRSEIAKGVESDRAYRDLSAAHARDADALDEKRGTCLDDLETTERMRLTHITESIKRLSNELAETLQAASAQSQELHTQVVSVQVDRCVRTLATSLAVRAIARPTTPLLYAPTGWCGGEPPCRFVQFDYAAQEDNEVSIEAGSAVRIVSRDDTGWWTVERLSDGASGLVPVNYLRRELVDEVNEALNDVDVELERLALERKQRALVEEVVQLPASVPMRDSMALDAIGIDLGTNTSDALAARAGLFAAAAGAGVDTAQRSPTPSVATTEDAPVPTSGATSPVQEAVGDGAAAPNSARGLASPRSAAAHDDLPSPSAALYRAVFPYTAAADDELSLKPGDELRVLEDVDGWYFGVSTATGASGLFPSNYVRRA